MQTDNLELKKLVYLYLMNYAKSQPDMAIMAVNTFVKVQHSPLTRQRLSLLYLSHFNLTSYVSYLSSFQDCEDTNPLIRALAVRTMGCIRVDKITEYLCEPLRKCLKVLHEQTAFLSRRNFISTRL